MRNVTFINAGAGSGKTYRLTTDLARMITQEGLNPSQVILTTYTELAAAEFREKARNEILNAKDQTGNLVDVSQRIKCATQLDNAFIGTVHAISFRFIRKYWYLLNYGSDIQPISGQNQDFYMSQSISEIISDGDRSVFRKFRDAFDIQKSGKPYHLFWLPELKDIVDKMDYYDINSVKESIIRSKSTAEAIFQGMSHADAFTLINSYLPDLKERCESFTDHGTYGKKAKRFIEAIDRVGYIKNLSDIREDVMKECLEDTIGKKDDQFYCSDSYIKATDAYKQTFVSKDYLPLIDEYLTTIFNLALQWRKALLDYKQEHHVISFDDMEKLFLSMLTEPRYKEVQDDVASNFRLLMVDEFQDSNPVQLKIFNRISELIAQNGGHSIWVGDPKQTIYGFRGSDSRFISEILEKFNFSQDGTPIPEQGSEMLGTDQLQHSWRSRPALVDFTNNVFLKPFKESGLQEKQIVLNAHFTQESDSLGQAQALYIWRTEQDVNEPRARMLATQIKALVDSKQMVHHGACDQAPSEINYRDIAVLCYSNSHCNNVASALRAIGLPASCEETNLIQCKEVYLLKTLLLFMQNPTDKMLRAELAMMLDDADIVDILKDRINYIDVNKPKDESEEDDKEEKAVKWDNWMNADTGHPYADKISRLTEFTQRYHDLSVYDTVVAIHEEMDLNNIVQKWGDATQRKHNLATVINMAKAYDDMCQQMGIGSSILGFISYLTITKPDNKTDNSANTIKVITYHRSKGLEWPVVILFQLWEEFDTVQDLAKSEFLGVNVCEKDDPATDVFSRKYYINLAPSGIGGSGNVPEKMLEAIVAIPLFNVISEQAKEEALRLLYVGVTRAKDMLVSLTSKNKKDGDLICKWPQSLGISDGHSDKPWGDGYNEELTELMESGSNKSQPEVSQYSFTANTPALNDAPLLYLSPSAIDQFESPFTGSEMMKEATTRIIDMEMFAGESSDAVKGSCIHNIFASYKQGDDKGNLDRITQTLANYGFPNVLLKQKENLIKSIDWLYNFLTEKYGPASRIETECPLLYQIPGGQILRGEIDMQWYFKGQDGQEKCILVDYKTFPGKRSDLEQHAQKKLPQLAAYHYVLTKAGIIVADTLIYYPVQAHVRRLI